MDGGACMCVEGSVCANMGHLYSSRCNSIQIYSILHIYIPIYSNLFKSILTYSILFHRPQRYANIFQCIQLYADLYTLYRAAVTTWTNWSTSVSCLTRSSLSLVCSFQWRNKHEPTEHEIFCQMARYMPMFSFASDCARSQQSRARCAVTLVVAYLRCPVHWRLCRITWTISVLIRCKQNLEHVCFGQMYAVPWASLF